MRADEETKEKQNYVCQADLWLHRCGSIFHRLIFVGKRRCGDLVAASICGRCSSLQVRVWTPYLSAGGLQNLL